MAAVAIGTDPTALHVLVVAPEAPSAYNVSVSHDRAANGPPQAGQAQYWSPYYHHVTITHLQPDTVYYYQPLVAGSRKDLTRTRPHLRTSTTGAYFTPQQAQAAVVMEEPDELEGDDEALFPDEQRRRRLAPPPYNGYEKACPAANKIRFFRTAPATPTSTTRLAIVGDLGQFEHSQETLQRLYRNPDEFDAMILAGDIAYAGTDGRKWDTFFDFWDDTPLAERIPVSLGVARYTMCFVARVTKVKWSSSIESLYLFSFPTFYRFKSALGTMILINWPRVEKYSWPMNIVFACLVFSHPSWGFTKVRWGP